MISSPCTKTLHTITLQNMSRLLWSSWHIILDPHTFHLKGIPHVYHRLLCSCGKDCCIICEQCWIWSHCSQHMWKANHPFNTHKRQRYVHQWFTGYHSRTLLYHAIAWLSDTYFVIFLLNLTVCWLHNATCALHYTHYCTSLCQLDPNIIRIIIWLKAHCLICTTYVIIMLCIWPISHASLLCNIIYYYIVITKIINFEVKPLFFGQKWD